MKRVSAKNKIVKIEWYSGYNREGLEVKKRILDFAKGKGFRSTSVFIDDAVQSKYPELDLGKNKSKNQPK